MSKRSFWTFLNIETRYLCDFGRYSEFLYIKNALFERKNAVVECF
jgi:hypothetical protein